MKLPQLINETIKIDQLIPGGQAIATAADGKKIFLWNALPGEVVTEFLVTKSKSHYTEATAMKFAQASPLRVKPHDECYLATSPWQILDEKSENTAKSELLAEIYRQHNLPDNLNTAFQGDGKFYAYRNKMEYALYYDHEDGQIHLAFHQRSSHRKVRADSSSLEMPAIFQRATKIINELNQTGADARDYQSLLLRASQTGTVSGGLYRNHQPHPNFSNLSDEILGRKYTYSPNGFFQINLPVYEMALMEIQPWIQTEQVLDLYAGVGTIGLSVAREQELTLVESNAAAYRELVTNCQGTTAQPVLAKSEEALDYIKPNQTVILDPPRSGCDAKLITRLQETMPTRIIYLSCNPATQARDVKTLLKSYQIIHSSGFNFFPRTPHLENLIVLEHKAWA